MRPLHKASHAGREGNIFSSITPNAGNRAQDTTPSLAAPQVAGNSIIPALTSTQELDDTPLPAAELSVRTYNALLKGRITTIRQLCDMELGDLKWLRNFGKKSLEETIIYRARLGAPVNS
jgi:DNA-directed RNA polymerase alpha subunit